MIIMLRASIIQTPFKWYLVPGGSLNIVLSGFVIPSEEGAVLVHAIIFNSTLQDSANLTIFLRGEVQALAAMSEALKYLKKSNKFDKDEKLKSLQTRITEMEQFGQVLAQNII
jgi:hypothetical protein